MRKVTNKIRSNLFVLNFLYIIGLELIYKLLVYMHSFKYIVYTVLFSLTMSSIITFIVRLFDRKKAILLLKIIYTVLLVYFGFQYIFTGLFSSPFSFYSVSLVSQALDFVMIAVRAIFSHILGIILLLVYYVLFIKLIISKRVLAENFGLRGGKIIKEILIVVIIYCLSLGSLIYDKEYIYSPYNLYYNINYMSKNIESFGLITATRIDAKRTIFGFKEKIIKNKKYFSFNKDIDNSSYNVLNIDFNKLHGNNIIKGLNDYFDDIMPTKKNEYTGMFRDKNVIFVLAESFNEIAVSEELTPTLYKLTNSGFVFNNFYSPAFLSTTGGEFQAMTGLLPTQETLRLWKTNRPKMSFALGHALGKNNYATYSYHDWEYQYYDRDNTMLSLGFDNFMGCGNGLEEMINCDWVPSDIEMISKTFPLYSDNRFMTYYVTISGHAPYDFLGENNIAIKNQDLVDDLEYSTEIKAYLASQIELDKAMELLINDLEEKNILDDTVIVLVGDHYPYTINVSKINEISTYNRDEIMEVNRSNLVIWNNKIGKIEVNKVGSQIDVLPTLLNLLGIDYDSRLMVGKDILSDSEGIAIFSNRSWITDKGRYYADMRKFVPNDKAKVDKDYVNRINTRVSNSFTISSYIIKEDYYRKILDN